MLKPAKQASSCSLDQLLLKPADDVSAKKRKNIISVFEARRVKGFWPVYNNVTGKKKLTVRELTTFFFCFRDSTSC